MVKKVKEVKTPGKGKTRTCLIIRHGEVNRTGKASDLDINLSPKGRIQAKETGIFVKKYVSELETKQGKKFDKIIVQTSPFLRCRATAARIAKPLKVTEIDINYRMSEWQTLPYITSNPLPHLKFKK